MPAIDSEARLGRQYDQIRERLAHPDEAAARFIFVLAEEYRSVTDFIVRLAGVEPATLGVEGPDAR